MTKIVNDVWKINIGEGILCVVNWLRLGLICIFVCEFYSKRYIGATLKLDFLYC